MANGPRSIRMMTMMRRWPIIIDVQLFVILTILTSIGLTWGCMSRSGSEYCQEPFVRTQTAISDLGEILRRDFFGQHIAVRTVMAALSSHLNDSSPEKPLVLSFHGSPGLGKSFLARIIFKVLYQNGANSKFVRFYSASRHFRDPKNVREYQKQIETDVLEVIKSCPRSIIVFDEVDMMPPKVLDALVPFMDRDDVVKGLDQKKAIYIFLSNQGAEAICDITKKAFDEKREREQLNFRDFEDAVRNEVFNAKKGGLKKAKIIQKFLVDHFIPFLPMERRHVIQCVQADMTKSGYSLNPETIADTLTYWPPGSKLYSVAGCKPVEKTVKVYGGENPFKDSSNNNNKFGEL